MKTKNVLLAVSDVHARAKLTNHFHSRGFNLLTTDMTEYFDPAILLHLNIDCAVVSDPRCLPGGIQLLKSLQEVPHRIPTIVLSEDAKTKNDFDTCGFEMVTLLTVSIVYLCFGKYKTTPKVSTKGLILQIFLRTGSIAYIL